MTKEIEIPEGYEARIEGNKVIIAQKESEDERIRKSLTDLVSWSKINVIAPIEVSDADKALAWLEKQKEQKHAEQLDDTFTSYDMAKTFMEGQNYVVAHPEKFGLCKSAEWSEEDEKHKQAFIDAIQTVMVECVDVESIEKYKDDIDWLENCLKSFRLQPQTVYKTAIESILEMCNSCNLKKQFSSTAMNFWAGVKVKCENALRAYQSPNEPYWKPSEEQMDHLAYAYTQLKLQKCYAPHVYESLGSLYDDLKKHFSL